MTVADQEQIAKKISSYTQQEVDFLANSNEFIEIIDSVDTKVRTDNFKNMIYRVLEVKRDDEGYFLDAFDKRISYNGVKSLKREFTQLKWTAFQTSEYNKCARDFEYFFYNYCKIMTKKGYNFPDIRPYQLNVIDGMKNHNRLLLSISRQMGKCIERNTLITIKNNETGVEELISVEGFHELLKREQNEAI